jgi:hypothetical protein
MKPRLIVALIALVVVSGSAVELFGQKTKKVKEKRYETVVKQNLKDYAGTYIGIEPDYVVEIRVTPDGRLLVNSLEDGQSVTLSNVKVTGARLTADKIYSGGRSGKFQGTFKNCILNGETFFGIHVEGLNIRLNGDITLDSVFYRRK